MSIPLQGQAPRCLLSTVLADAVSAILQGYRDGQGPVTDTSAELHRLCGCLELLLQVGPSLPLSSPPLFFGFEYSGELSQKYIQATVFFGSQALFPCLVSKSFMT